MTHACSIKAAVAVKVTVVVVVVVQSCRLKKEKGRSHNKISTDHYHETELP